MKLFKNGVGRPSNETKQMRRVFVVCIAAIVISAVALLVSLLSKSGILTSSLKGAASYSVSYGLWGQNNNDITIRSYPSYRSHNGTVKFPTAPSYTVKSGKTCSFKGWIFQKQDDGRYRYRTTSGSYVWYRSSLDSGKYKVSNYAFFKPGSSYKLGAIKVKLYAAFDCGNSTTYSSSSSNLNVANNQIGIVYEKNASYATGSMSSKVVTRSGTINLDLEKFELEGYAFDGWKAYRIINGSKKYFVKGKGWTATSASKGTTIANGSSLSAEYKIAQYTGGGNTIYMQAQWSALRGKSNYYTIVFKANGGTGSMSNQQIKKASNGGSNLKGHSLSRSGYTFNGWKSYRIINGSKKYFVKGKGWTATSASKGTTVKNRADIQKNNDLNMDKYTSAGNYIYLEAQWKASSWTIKIDRNGGTTNWNTRGNTTYYWNSGYGLPTCSDYAVKSGYKCTGWKLYRKDVNGGRTTYFTTSPKWGWQTTNSGSATVFKNGYRLSNIKNYISYGKTFYIQIQWVKK